MLVHRWHELVPIDKGCEIVRLLIAGWLQNGGAFSDGWCVVNVAIKRLSNPPSRGCGEKTKKRTF